MKKKLRVPGQHLDLLRKNLKHFRTLLYSVTSAPWMSQSVTPLQRCFMKFPLTPENGVRLESSMAFQEVPFLLGSGSPASDRARVWLCLPADRVVWVGA